MTNWNDPEDVKAYRKKWREENPDKIKAQYARAYAKRDPAVRAAYAAQYKQENKERVNAITRAFYQRNLEAVNAYKSAKGCEECGYNKHPVALQFHHRDPSEKAFTIGQKMNRMCAEKLLAEASKCIVLCANCHKIHHSVNNEVFKQHKKVMA